MDKILNFLKDVRLELSKVNWPTKNQTIQYTAIVIGVSLFLAVFLGAVDFGLQKVLTTFIVK